MKQYLLRFSLPSGVRMYPNVLREALARSNTLPPEFFGYDPETGKPLCEKPLSADKTPTQAQLANPKAIPPIRIVGATTWVGILATGEQAKQLLDAATMPAIAAVTAHCKQPVPVQVEEHDLSIASQEWPTEYWVREMVIKKGLATARDEETQMAVIKRRLEASLMAQADHYGMDCPPESLLDIRITEIVRSRGLQIVGSDGPTPQYAALFDVRFLAHAALKGFWFAGNLTARGYGRIGSATYGKGAA